MIPGEIIASEGRIELNANRRVIKLRVESRGDRPIQVGSHFHFFEVNRALRFDRDKAYGKRLNIPAGTAIRFDPGDEKEIELVDFGGRKKLYGFNGLSEGGAQSRATAQLKKWGY